MRIPFLTHRITGYSIAGTPIYAKRSFRCWLVELIAGDMAVAINLNITGTVDAGSRRVLARNCYFNQNKF
jgi:hypothetical protein